MMYIVPIGGMVSKRWLYLTSEAMAVSMVRTFCQKVFSPYICDCPVHEQIGHNAQKHEIWYFCTILTLELSPELILGMAVIEG